MPLQLVGSKLVIVPGGGPAINNTLEAMKIKSHFANGHVTDEVNNGCSTNGASRQG